MDEEYDGTEVLEDNIGKYAIVGVWILFDSDLKIKS